MSKLRVHETARVRASRPSAEGAVNETRGLVNDADRAELEEQLRQTEKEPDCELQQEMADFYLKVVEDM
jgi:hypothetical protein